MMMWLRNAHASPSDADVDVDIGIDAADGVVRREAFATLVELDEAGVVTRARCKALIDAAHARAARIEADAEARAAARVAEADAQYQSACADGRAAGLREAAANWHADAASHYADERALMMNLRARLASLVTGALERLAGVQDRARIFAQAAHEIEQLIDAGGVLSVRVHPDEREIAQREFAACAARWLENGRPMTLSVQGDPSLPPGACCCESPLGTLDASLDVQLAALREALDAALQRVPLALPPRAAQDESVHGDEALTLQTEPAAS